MRFKDTFEYLEKYDGILEKAERCIDVLNEHEISAIQDWCPRSIKERERMELIDDDEEKVVFDPKYKLALDRLQDRCDNLMMKYEKYHDMHDISQVELDYLRMSDDVEKMLASIHRILDIGNEENLDRISLFVGKNHKNIKEPNCFEVYETPESIVKLSPEDYVFGNLKLIWRVVKRQCYKLGLPYEDILMEVLIRAIGTANRFDPLNGFKFSSYIIGPIIKSINTLGYKYANDGIHFESKYRAPAKYFNLKNLYYNEYGEDISSLEIAEILDIPEDKAIPSIIESFDNHKVYSYDDQIERIDWDVLYDENDDNFPDALKDSFESESYTDDKLIYESLQIEISETLKKLKPNKKSIIEMYFGLYDDEKDLQEIADILKLSRERIRQILTNGIKRLKRHRNLIEYFPIYRYIPNN